MVHIHTCMCSFHTCMYVYFFFFSSLFLQNTDRKEDPKNFQVVGSTQGGKWRVWGAGNYAIAGSDAKVFQMNEKFKGWGGEDDDFLARASGYLNVVRARDPFIEHIWHQKDCSKLRAMGKKKVACLGSMAEYEGSALSFVLADLDRRNGQRQEVLKKYFISE